MKGVNESPHREKLRQAIGEERLGLIRRTTVVDWLPIEVHLAVADATVHVLGTDGARAFWKERLLASFLTKAMAPFVAGASVVFGTQPYALMKMAMSSYKLMARDAGRITVTTDEGGAVVMDFVEAPTVLGDSIGWHALCHGQCQAVLAHLGMRGDIGFKILGPHTFRYVVHRTR